MLSGVKTSVKINTENGKHQDRRGEKMSRIEKRKYGDTYTELSRKCMVK